MQSYKDGGTLQADYGLYHCTQQVVTHMKRLKTLQTILILQPVHRNQT